MPTTPTTKQTAFLLVNHILEVLYGGAAGGGKSEGLLMAASQYVDVPGYSALLLRRTFRDLAQPGALMSRSHEWWDGTDAHWDGNNRIWRFPSGATISFGYMDHENDEQQYQSAEYQYIGFDELTHFPKHQYTYMFSRLRRLRGIDLPIRMRGGTNPGGRGHEWVKDRWGLPNGTDNPDRLFISALLDDNPHLDATMHEKSLKELGELHFRQLRMGDWMAVGTGGKFDPAWFTVLTRDELKPNTQYWTGQLRHWDLASLDATDENPDPDWTAGAKIVQTGVIPDSVAEWYVKTGREMPNPPYWIILNISRVRQSPGGVEDFLRSTARVDGRRVPHWIEQERGSSGKHTVNLIRNHVLPEYTVRGLWTTGSKEERANQVAARAKEGRVFLREGPWVDAFLEEAGAFPGQGHDDQIDAVSGAFIALEKEGVMKDTSGIVGQH